MFGKHGTEGQAVNFLAVGAISAGLEFQVLVVAEPLRTQLRSPLAMAFDVRLARETS